MMSLPLAPLHKHELPCHAERETNLLNQGIEPARQLSTLVELVDVVVPALRIMVVHPLRLEFFPCQIRHLKALLRVKSAKDQESR